MLDKVLTVAMREFKATAMTRAFLFGVVIFPLVIFGGITAASSMGLFKSAKPALEGVVAVSDGTPGMLVAKALDEHFAAARRLAENPLSRDQLKAKAREEMSKRMGPEAAAKITDEQIDRALEMAEVMGVTKPAKVTIETLPEGADMKAQEQRVLSGELLAAVNVDKDTLDPSNGTWGLVKGKKLDIAHVQRIREAVKRCVIDIRYQQQGWNPVQARLLANLPDARTETITAEGKTGGFDELSFIMPMIFMMLLWISVMTGGQYLLTSTIEEKSSRVMEVLLSAISPLQLLTGKIIGQGLVGLAILVIYAGLGVAAAQRFGALSLIPMDRLPWLVMYFMIAYFFFAALMAAIGSAVTEVREAQSLMGPVMMLLMFPLVLWMPITRNPNNVLSVIMSFIPPMTPFVMMLRTSQTADPVPMWQVIASTVVAVAGVVVVVWAAAKIFRIGVLMYGKPPSPLELLKWIRHA